MSPPAAQSAAFATRPVVPSGVLGMVIFLGTETMFFAALISAFLVLRAQIPEWPPAGQPRLPVLVTGLNTLVLLASGWTVQRAARAGRGPSGPPGARGSDFTRWLAATAALGLVFLVVQGTEWVRLVHFGLTTSSSLYGATFYALVGAHAAHVLAAVVVLAVAWRLAARGRLGLEGGGFEPYRLYWLFVVAVWPVLYGLVYFA